MATRRKRQPANMPKHNAPAATSDAPARLSLRMPCYERAFSKLVNDLAYAFARAGNPLIAKLGFKQEVPVLYGQQVSGPGGTKTIEAAPISHEMAISHDDLLWGNRESFLVLMWDLGEKLAAGLTQQLIAHLNEVTSATGMVLNGKQYPNRVERFLAMLDKVDLVFDQEGNFQPPTIMAGTKETKSLMEELDRAGPEARMRYDAIVARKREAWLASRSNRCLPQLFQD